MAKEEKYIKEQDRKNAQNILRARIKKESFGLDDNEHGRFFDERGDLVEDEFQKFFKEVVAESGVSETSFCKMLSMGYRLDLIRDIKGLVKRALAGGGKNRIALRGGYFSILLD